MSEPNEERALSGTEYKLVSKVCSHGCGEIWRGEHPTHGSVLVSIYSADSGKATFAEAKTKLERWRELADSGNCPGFVPILEISESDGVPFVAFPNPGGLSLREAVPGPLKPRDAVHVVVSVAKPLNMAVTYEVYGVGISPDNIFGNPNGEWQIVPVCPGTESKYAALSGGSYSPPEMESSSASAREIFPDSYALAWLAVEMIVGGFGIPRDAQKLPEWVPYERLRTILRNGVTPSGGSYGESRLMMLGLERWLKAEAVDDIKAVEEAAAAKERTPAQQFFHQHKKNMMIGGIALSVVAVLFLCVMFLPSIFVAKNTQKTPYGLTNLFFEALADGDAAEAKKYALGPASGQVDRILEDIKEMEENGLASKFAEGVPQVHGDGDKRTAKIDLKGVNGDVFMEAEITIEKMDSGNWKVQNFFYKPLREPENN